MSADTASACTAGGLSIAVDPWLSGVMSREVRRVSGMVEDGGEAQAQRNLQRATGRPGFTYARVPTHDMRTSQLLECCGFHIVDTGITLEVHGLTDSHGGQGGVRLARAEDQAAVEEIARRSVKYSRFHLDPNIPQKLANEIKVQWAGNYFRGQRGDYMVVAERAGKVVGFLELLEEPGEVLVIDLIALVQNHRRQGLAEEMIRFASFACIRPRVVRAGTQVANAVSLRLYQKIGFQIVSSSFIFHHHQFAS